jgi:hypothetical protein
VADRASVAGTIPRPWKLLAETTHPAPTQPRVLAKRTVQSLVLLALRARWPLQAGACGAVLAYLHELSWVEPWHRLFLIPLNAATRLTLTFDLHPNPKQPPPTENLGTAATTNTNHQSGYHLPAYLPTPSPTTARSLIYDPHAPRPTLHRPVPPSHHGSAHHPPSARLDIPIPPPHRLSRPPRRLRVPYRVVFRHALCGSGEAGAGDRGFTAVDESVGEQACEWGGARV